MKFIYTNNLILREVSMVVRKSTFFELEIQNDYHMRNGDIS